MSRNLRSRLTELSEGGPRPSSQNTCLLLQSACVCCCPLASGLRFLLLHTWPAQVMPHRLVPATPRGRTRTQVLTRAGSGAGTRGVLGAGGVFPSSIPAS